MRSRKPRPFALVAQDVPILQQMARSRILPWFPVQRARTVLAMADGERVQTVAFQSQCDPSTVWRLCRRYEQALPKTVSNQRGTFRWTFRRRGRFFGM